MTNHNKRKRSILTKVLLFAALVFAFSVVPLFSGGEQNTVMAATRKLNKTKVSFRAGTTYTIKLNGVSSSKVTWKTSNKKVATVYNGKIAGIKKGTATITATYKGKSYTCKATVKYGKTKLSNGIVYEDVYGTGTFDTTGRWFMKQYYDKSYVFTNTGGSAIYFKVTGSKYVKLRFLNLAEKETPMYAYSIDGKDFIRKRITSTKINLGNTKTHYVRLVIDAISQDEDKWNEHGVGIMSIKGETKGSVVTAIRPQNKLIAFYGDSITEGIRNQSVSLTPSGCSSMQSYAYYCATNLGRIPFFAGYGGSGITVDGSFKQALVAFQNQSAGAAATTIDSDVIVIEHGTNDPDNTDITAGYSTLLDTIHATNPNATIIAMIPLNQKHAARIRTAAAGRSYCKVFETSGLALSYTDGNLHPTADANKILGQALANFIR